MQRNETLELCLIKVNNQIGILGSFTKTKKYTATEMKGLWKLFIALNQYSFNYVSK